MNPLQDLDSDQIKVATHTTGPAMVIAGAGSGKTRALIQRIAYLVAQGTAPTKILATTFTRKAAGEIQQRLRRFGVPCETRQREGVRVGTLHSTAYDILRDSTEYKFWEVNNTFESGLAGLLLDELFPGGSPKLISKASALEFISLAKNHARGPSDAGLQYDSWFAQGQFELYADSYLHIYRRFEEIRRERKLLTYDDMLLEAWRVLDGDPAACRRWQERFDYVLIDEAQDTNLVQFYIVETLADLHRNYMVIGDPFQSIYSWRGAYPVYMRDFPERYPDAVVYTMGKNYRCARDILSKASNVIGNCAGGGFKQLKLEAVRTCEGDVGLQPVESDKFQAQWVARQIGRQLAAGVAAKDIAVLYRIKLVGKMIENAMYAAGLPHKRLDGLAFFERPAVKALLQCLTLIIHPTWLEAGCQALDAIKFVGPATLTKLRTAPGEDLLAKAEWLGSGPRGMRIQKRQQENLRRFVAVIRSCTDLAPVPAIDAIVSGIDFVKAFNLKKLEREEGEEDLYQDVALLRTRAEKFADIEALVQHTLKLGGQEQGDVGNRVSLSTIHRVKGLEFPHVYVVSAIEGVLPLKCAAESRFPEHMEEERRLFYVASTRAMDSLTVVTPRCKFDFKAGTNLTVAPSRFVVEAGLLSEAEANPSGAEVGY